MMPKVDRYPRCPECGLAYVLRRSFDFVASEWVWLWARDCKHRTIEPVACEEEPVA